MIQHLVDGILYSSICFGISFIDESPSKIASVSDKLIQSFPLLAGRQWLLFQSCISEGIPESKVTCLSAMNQSYLIVEFVIRSLMRLQFPSLSINKLIRRLSKANQALPTLHYRAILQAAKILFVVL